MPQSRPTQVADTPLFCVHGSVLHCLVMAKALFFVCVALAAAVPAIAFPTFVDVPNSMRKKNQQLPVTTGSPCCFQYPEDQMQYGITWMNQDAPDSA